MFEDKRRHISSSVPSSPHSPSFGQSRSLYTIPSASNSEKTDPPEGSTPDLPENGSTNVPKHQVKRSSSANFVPPVSSTPAKGSPSASLANQIMEHNAQSLTGAVELLTARKPEEAVSRSSSSSASTPSDSTKGKRSVLSKFLGNGINAPVPNDVASPPPTPNRPGRGRGDKNAFIAPQQPRRRAKSNAVQVKFPSRASNGKLITTPIPDKGATIQLVEVTERRVTLFIQTQREE